MAVKDKQGSQTIITLCYKLEWSWNTWKW